MGWRNLISCFLTLVLTLGRMSRGHVLLWATPVAVEAGNTPGQGSMPGLLAPCYVGSKRAHLFPAFLPIRPAPLHPARFQASTVPSHDGALNLKAS